MVAEHADTVIKDTENTAPTLLPWMTDRHGIVSSEWRRALPVLTAPGVTLRNLRLEDAPSLAAMLSTEEVARFISPPPTTVEGFEQFITWVLERQAAGRYICFAVVPAGMDRAVGIIQLQNLQGDFSVTEWGFAIGSPYWGTGLFVSAAHLVMEFAFTTLGVGRLDARCVVENGRGTGALRKLGAVPERLIPRGLIVGTKKFDQCVWTITREQYESGVDVRPPVRSTVH